MAKKKYYSKGGMRKEKDGMIKENRSAVANLPQEVMMRDWPRIDGDYMMSDLNDSILGVDAQMYEDARGRNKGKSKGKYPEKY